MLADFDTEKDIRCVDGETEHCRESSNGENNGGSEGFHFVEQGTGRGRANMGGGR